MNSDVFRDKLINAKDEKEILEIFQDEEQNYPDI
jgi:mannitol/fructose-specific phosphotransferase system IIA component (Ntr-type)